MAANIKKITSILFILRIFRMSMSMVTLIFSAKYFGVSMERDVWILVTTFLITICSAIWGPINETFRAKFIFIKEQEGEVNAIQKTLSLLSFIVSVTLLISLFILLFLHPITSFIVQNPTEESSHLFVSLLLLMLPTFLINELTNIGISVLNAYEIYYVPEMVGALSSLLNILIIVLLAPLIGIYSLAISQYVAIIILLSVILWKIYNLHIFHWRSLFKFRFSHISGYLLFALPFFFPYFVGQCNSMAEKWLSGMLGEGNISSLDYARQFTVVLQNVLSSILTTVMVPMLAKAYVQKNTKDFERITKENLTVCFAILGLAIPILFGAASPLCEFFFLRGKVSSEALGLITILTRMYAVAFIGVLLYLVFGCTLLASDKGKRYALWGVLTQIMVLGANIMLLPICNIYIFPISLGVAHLFAAIVMSLGIPSDIRKHLFKSITKYCMVVVFLSVCTFYFNKLNIGAISLVSLICNILFLIPLFLFMSKWFDLDIKTYYYKLSKKIK